MNEHQFAELVRRKAELLAQTPREIIEEIWEELIADLRDSDCQAMAEEVEKKLEYYRETYR